MPGCCDRCRRLAAAKTDAVANLVMAWAAGRMRQGFPNQKAHDSTDFRLSDFASTIKLGALRRELHCLLTETSVQYRGPDLKHAVGAPR
jgi:hypothetical protein